MLYDDNIPVTPYLVPAIEDLPGIGSPNGGSPGGGDVDSVVFHRSLDAKFSRDVPLYGPDKAPSCQGNPFGILSATPSSPDVVDIDIDL